MNAQIAYDLEHLQLFLTGRRTEGESRTAALLRRTKDDAVIHVEIKGHSNGTRRERKTKQ